MHRIAIRGVRLLGVLLALTLAFQFLQPGSALAAGSLTLNPTSGSPGTPVSATGTGFIPNETVSITFSGFGQVATAVVGSNGDFATGFNVPNVASGPATVQATGANTTAQQPFTVTNAGPTTTLMLQKSVSINGGTYSSGGNATNGQTLSYALQYSNTGTVTANNVVITDTLQPGQTLQSAPGCTATVGNNGLTTVTCTVASVPAAPAAGSTATFFITTQVSTTSSGTISNTAQATANNANAAVQSNQTVVTVNGGTTPGPYTLRKFVSVNGQGYYTSGTAQQGDTLIYDIQFTNPSTNGTANNVVIYDTLQPGQTLLSYPGTSSSCTTYNNVTGTVTCPIGNVAPGTTVHIQIATEVTGTGTGTISNQASATINGAGPIASNTTVVEVIANNPPPPTNGGGGTFTLCGTISVFTSTTVTINGITVTTTTNVVITGSGAYGQDDCIAFGFNGQGQATSMAFSSNLSGQNVICGTYQPSTNSGTIFVAGIAIAVASNSNFQPYLTNGGYYCFLLTSNGVAYAALNGIPTSATAAHSHPAALARGRERAF